jgi:MOSC domain-containing protein YiiM
VPDPDFCSGEMTLPMTSCGTLIGIARRPARLVPMQTIEAGRISTEGGLDGDHKGPKFPRRQITVLALEAWAAALAELGPDAADLPWTARRANLLVAGVALPRAIGGVVAIGPVILEVTFPTVPCGRMDAAFPGLRKALHPDWRGGITAKVLEGGNIAIGDAVSVLVSPPEQKRRLPG